MDAFQAAAAFSVRLDGIDNGTRHMRLEHKFDAAVRKLMRIMWLASLPLTALTANAQTPPLEVYGKLPIAAFWIHGKDDTVVSYSQSKDMGKALRKAGKVVELVTLNGEDHWLSKSATRLEMLQRASEFIRKYNPPD
jgi:pimeloyl-ACP methyl ester carboxylesterase